jgi:hypothetical protein
VQADALNYRVELASVPDWLPARVHRRILSSLVPGSQCVSGANLTESVYRRAQANPWLGEIRQVRLHHSNDSSRAVVRVEAEVRSPMAQVVSGSQLLFVDRHGVVLPYADVPKYVVRTPSGKQYYSQIEAVPPNLHAQPLRYLTIEGVRGLPGEPGQHWPGSDLAVALRLAALVLQQPFGRQIEIIDVRNHGRRVSRSSAELCLLTRPVGGRMTEIRFGRFPREGGGDWVIPSERKMAYLRSYAEENGGQIAGLARWLDLRYDQLHVSLD